MEQQTINQQILNELKQLRVDINIIKEDLNGDSQLTEEEEQLLDESYENEKNGALISSEDLKEELEI